MMAGHDHIIHASAYDMKVVSEPLANVVNRGKEIIGAGFPQPSL
jgi:hypothetical protein